MQPVGLWLEVEVEVENRPDSKKGRIPADRQSIYHIIHIIGDIIIDSDTEVCA